MHFLRINRRRRISGYEAAFETENEMRLSFHRETQKEEEERKQMSTAGDKVDIC